jgi:hypothetical protein
MPEIPATQEVKGGGSWFKDKSYCEDLSGKQQKRLRYESNGRVLA